MDPRREFFDFNQFLGNGSLNEILDILCEDEEGSGKCPMPELIFIAPPDLAILTDEDSDDEDSGGRAENLNARQLTADAEVRFEKRYQTHRHTLRFDDLCGRWLRTWIHGNLEPFLGSFPEIATDIDSQSAVDLFELFIDDDIIDMFILQSNRYVLWKNCPDIKITAAEMRCFFGIFILSGYSPNANRRLYWSTEIDNRNELICNSMRCNRFEEIMRFMHCVDNNELELNDRMWKLHQVI
ncbi:unnamed protein product [Parnassius mnemosyne]|uniref:PiggyBac transposable element-derived protein domain-containing protein n=1 Tax=Parnassius mnemosyne TaxID=213953 RepID=A0AAV1KMW4_9NEOP